MRGSFHNREDKWLHINQLMRDDKMAILVLQETYLSDNHINTLNRMFSDCLLITSSLVQDHPHSEGVAILFNKRLLGSKGIGSYVIRGKSSHEIWIIHSLYYTGLDIH
ncbi:hypothetical protein ID866_11868 [Astraeus odoratus]|nr:hypothetical protein ID866_11868 [Astraeus odoratus]